MGTDAGDPPSRSQPRLTARGRRIAVAVSVTAVVLVAVAIAFAAWPRPACDDTKRNALLSVPTFGDVSVPVEDLPGPGGCLMTYVVAGDADEIAHEYADRLQRAGWRGGPEQQIHEHPNTLWVDVAGIALEDAGWHELRYEVTVTQMGPAQARVEAAVMRDERSIY